MTHDLAVWEGPPPLSNAHAGSECERRLATPEPGPPTPPVQAFIDHLAQRFPDFGTPASPWLDGPLAAGAAGTMAYFSVDSVRLPEVRPVIEEAAGRLQLVAFDPQVGELMPSAVTIDRSAEFDLPSPAELPLHLAAVIGEALEAKSTMAGIVEQIGNGFYVQWMAKGGALTIEAQGESVLPPQLQLSQVGLDQMMSMGFEANDPNWSLHLSPERATAEEAARVLGEVFSVVRRLPAGTPMKLQTFPV